MERAEQLDYRPGVVMQNGEPIPVLSFATKRERYAIYPCVGHRLEGEGVYEVLRAAQEAINAANKLK